MKKWERIIEALDNPSRIYRARFLFEFVEEERRDAVEEFRKSRFLDEVKMEARKILLQEKENND